MNRSFAALLLVPAAALLISGCGSSSSTSSTDNTTAPAAPSGGATGNTASSAASLTIAVIPKGTTHEYWKSVEAGAEAAGKDRGVNIVWKGPLQESDRAGQIAIVQEFTSDNVSGIVLAPLDDTALVSPVAAAKAANIPVVIIDSALKGTPGTDYTSFVATDNLKGGTLGGQQLAKILGGKGKVVMLRYQAGSASTQQREDGFEAAIKAVPGITVISDNQYAGATQGEAQTAAMNMVDQLKAADGIFCPNESSTMGMLQALRQNNLAGKVKFVGFDTTPALIDALKKGEINALVAQNPVKMGYEGVETVVDKIQGKPVPAKIDTGVTVVTLDNLNSPEVQKLLAGK